MKKHFEKRANYDVAWYEVEITPMMKMFALNFATRIITSDNQYLRLSPQNVRDTKDMDLIKKIEIQRTYMGKLGELAFLQFLIEKEKKVNVTGMLDIFDGQENVDDFDFITKTGKSVDVKTGFRNIHSRLLINEEQFSRIPKDYYVAVKLNAEDSDAANKLVDWDSVNRADILGYSDKVYIEKYVKKQNFGEGMARFLKYSSLMGIDRLTKEF